MKPALAARHRRPRGLLPCLGALLAATLAACAPAAGRADAGAALELYRSALLAPGIEIHAAQDLLDTARGAAREVESRSGRPVVVLPIGGAGDARRLRVLFGRTDEPAIQSVLDGLEVEVDTRGFGLLGRRYEGERDAIALDAPDPDRPGQPLRLVAGNDTAALRAAAGLLVPGWRPRFEVWREGRPECGGRFEGAWPCRPAIEFERGEAWSAFRAASRTVAEGPLRLTGTFDGGAAERARGYLTRAGTARARALAWAGVDAATVPGQVLAHESPRAMFERLGRVELSLPGAIGGEVHALIDDGGLDDGGRLLAETAAVQALGPPAAGWLRGAVGVWGANRWWDRDLDAWVARLHQGTLALSVAELVGAAPLPPCSEHRLLPQQAFLFGWLLETRGPDWVRGLWDGSRTLVADEGLETAFHAALEANREALAERTAPRRAAARRRARTLPRLRGVHLIPPLERDALLGRAGLEALAELRALGANAVSLPVESWFEDGRLVSDRGDAELVLFARRAGDAGFVPVLLPRLLASPSGELLARVKLEGVAAWEAMFERYTAFAVHHALVAELAQVPLLSIGDDLGTAVDTRRREIEAVHREDELGQRMRRQLDPAARAAAVLEAEGIRLEREFRDVRRTGWTEVVARARGVFEGQLTYVAARPVEREKFDRWGDLDAMGSSLFLPLETAEERAQGVDRRRLGPSPEQLRGRLSAQLDKLAADAALVQRPALVLGVGFPASDGAWDDPRRRAGALDLDAARIHGEALAEALATAFEQHASLAGYFLWAWHVDPARRLERPRGFDLRNGRDDGLLRRMLGGR